ncbi:hypothetical protein [Bacillus thuringiensis]|uniref:hypothetical protein n=1 Tax=Bacillus thuringiensis TaxID=1428 RepID=UPI003459780E
MLLQSKWDSVIQTSVLTGTPGPAEGAKEPLITANNACIINTPTQIYFVTYEAESSVENNRLASVQLQLGDVIFGGTQSRVTGQPVGSAATLISSAVNTGAASAILMLVNDSDGFRNSATANINIVKLQ